jgi:hypothetical protein
LEKTRSYITLCIGKLEAYENLETNYYITINLLFIFFAFFHLEPSTFSYSCQQLLAELDDDLTTLGVPQMNGGRKHQAKNEQQR